MIVVILKPFDLFLLLPRSVSVYQVDDEDNTEKLAPRSKEQVQLQTDIVSFV